jgi:hypothetical protein
MAILNNSNAISTSGDYAINNSLRFRSSASAYLNRTPASTTNQTTWTWSAWVKRGALGNGANIASLFSATNGSGITYFGFFSSDTFRFLINNTTTVIETSQVFRDPSAWYHIVLAWDTTQATASNRVKLYVNGNQVTALATTNYPAQNAICAINQNVAHLIAQYASANYFDGYLAEVNFVDGQALTPSSFGETDTTTGSWKPKAYTSTYGTNGFYLKFSDIATTSGSNAGLGKDFSGNANYWTTNNISVTAGTTYDAMIDSPTLTSATVANYCVLNPLSKNTNVTVSNANLTATSAVSNAGISGTMYMPSTGKYYWEATCTTNTTYPIVGIVNTAWLSGTNALTYPGATSGSYGYANDGTKYNNGSNTSYGASYTSGDIIGVAYDADTGTLTFYKNNTSQGSAYTGLTDIYAPAVSGQGSDVWNMNFGQRPFSYTPPSGFVRLNTFNLPTPTILQGNKYMDATTYTGTGTTQVIVNQALFKPDFVWVKSRSNITNNSVYDSVRGFNASPGSPALFTNLTDAEGSSTNTVSSANSNGFTISGSSNNLNTNAYTYVGWQWQAGQGSTSSNTSGSITSTVSVNTTAGFSVVTFTANNVTGATVGHGLGVAPKMMIVKCRSNTQSWPVYHATLGNTKYLMLNTTAAEVANIGMWNNTSPTSTVFTIGDPGFLWTSGFTYVTYCWAEIAGFSKFGSYTGNGSADGPFIYLGFRPKFIITKMTSGADEWITLDSARSDVANANTNDQVLNPYSSAAESSGSSYGAPLAVDFLSNGFKIRGTQNANNNSGSTFIYMAFASNPFKNSNAF